MNPNVTTSTLTDRLNKKVRLMDEDNIADDILLAGSQITGIFCLPALVV